MRVYRVIARKQRGVWQVHADVSGQGRTSVRIPLGKLKDVDLITGKVDALREATSLKHALAVRGGM